MIKSKKMDIRCEAMISVLLIFEKLSHNLFENKLIIEKCFTNDKSVDNC